MGIPQAWHVCRFLGEDAPPILAAEDTRLATIGATVRTEEVATPNLAVQSSFIPRVGPFSDVASELKGTGIQANHLNQNAAFSSIIPRDAGLAVGMRGNAFAEVGSPHYEFHSSLEEFWGAYRKRGDLFGQVPTNAQYGAAVERALVQSGYSPAQAASIAGQAAAQRLNYGLMPNEAVPRIPGPTQQSP